MAKKEAVLSCPFCRQTIDMTGLAIQLLDIKDAPNVEILETILKCNKYTFENMCQFKYKAIMTAINNGNTKIFEWWFTRYPFKTKLQYWFAGIATARNRTSILKVMKQNMQTTDWELFAQELIFELLEKSFLDKDNAFATITCETLSYWYDYNAFNRIIEMEASDILGVFTQHNALDRLNWWVDHKLPIYFSGNGFKECSIELLNWWYRRMPLLFKELNISPIIDVTLATQKLDWWKGHVPNFQYSEEAITTACKYNSIHTLNWWADSGLELKIDDHLYETIINVRVLEWLFDHALPGNHYKYFLNHIMLNACSRKDLQLMEWCRIKSHELNKIEHFMFSQKCIDALAKTESIELLQWWKQSGLPLRYTQMPFDDAIIHGNLELLKWWIDNCPKVRISPEVLVDAIVENEDIHVVEWLFENVPKEDLSIDLDLFVTRLLNRDFYEEEMKKIYTRLRQKGLCFSNTAQV